MLTIIYKPTLACDQSCKYCYVRLRDQTDLFPSPARAFETFSLLLDNLRRSNEKKVNIIFHGGEPLLLGTEYFEKCSSLIERYAEYGIGIKKCIQSNLLHATSNQLQGLKQLGYEISTSIDGTQLAHDAFRIDKKGAGTFERVVRNIRLAQSIGLVINAICCVSSFNVSNPKAAYEFFEKLGVNPKFNYLEMETPNLPEGARITPEEYGRFVIDVTSRWLARGNSSRIDVMPSSDMLGALISGFSECCFHATDCQRHFICVGPDGDVWPCGKCIGMQTFRLGNLADDRSPLLHQERQRRLFGKAVGIAPECTECEYSQLCRGLCPFDVFAEHGDFVHLTRWCRAYKILWPGMRQLIIEYKIDEISTSGLCDPNAVTTLENGCP